jgi:16S rRNA (cytosine967-C5)-methyltransferase
VNEREKAWLALRRIERTEARADFAIEAEVGEERERGFLRTVVLGALRNRTKLDYLIEKLAKRNVESIDPDVSTLLRTALYELHEMRSPAYAVVNEATGIAARRFPRAKGFVNGVLRSASRTPLDSLLPEDDSPRSISVRTGHPEWLLRRWIRHFGADRAARIAEADQEASWPDLLVNTRRISLGDAESLLESKGIEHVRSPFGIPVLRLRTSTVPVAEEIATGLFHAMDEGSVLVAHLIREGSAVADLAAAPGGKTIVLGMRNCRVTASDVSMARLMPLRAAAKRFLNEPPFIVAADATRIPFRARFDAVLLDAPCSATGTLRKNPEARWRTGEADLTRYAEAQLAMLRASASIAGGEILYSTCSLEPEENRDVVARFLETNRDFERGPLVGRVPPLLRPAVDESELSLTPEYGTDGFTVTLLTRRT